MSSTVAEDATTDSTPTSTPQQGTARIRLADSGDVGQIHAMVRQMAEFMRLTQFFTATEEQLLSMLFPTPPRAPPFNTFTVLLVEVHPSTSPPADSASTNPHFRSHLLPTTLPAAGSDPDASPSFVSARGGGWVTAGFVLVFPNCSTFQAQAGLFVQNLFVRGPYRRRGLGKALLRAVAAQANEMGLGVIDLFVLQWNRDAVRFYEGMGAHVMQGWCLCHFSANALHDQGDVAGEDSREEEARKDYGPGKGPEQ